MFTIGVTGGVGAGKSTVLAHLEKEYGAVVVRADELGHDLMEPGGECYQAVIELFGRECLLPDGTIDRACLAAQIFAREELRQELDAIIHPGVRAAILERRQRAAREGKGLFVVEAALLLEAGYEGFCDEIWYVYAPEEVRLKRLQESRGYTREKSLSIMEKQLSEEEFRDRCDQIIDNSGTEAQTREQVDALLSNCIDKGRLLC